MGKNMILPKIVLTSGVTMHVTAFRDGTPFVGSRMETAGTPAYNFTTTNLYLSPSTAAEYGAALIKAAKLVGWVEDVTAEVAA